MLLWQLCNAHVPHLTHLLSLCRCVVTLCFPITSTLNSVNVTRCGYDIPCVRAEVINLAASLLWVPYNW